MRAARDAGAGAREDDVRTVVSELATNAVLHARTPFSVSVTTDGTRLRVAVTDGSAARPRPRRHGDEASTGRGLHIVVALSTAWGVDDASPGKTTWCDLEIAPGRGSRADGDVDGGDDAGDDGGDGGDAPAPDDTDDLDALLDRFGGDGSLARAA